MTRLHATAIPLPVARWADGRDYGIVSGYISKLNIAPTDLWRICVYYKDLL